MQNLTSLQNTRTTLDVTTQEGVKESTSRGSLSVKSSIEITSVSTEDGRTKHSLQDLLPEAMRKTGTKTLEEEAELAGARILNALQLAFFPDSVPTTQDKEGQMKAGQTGASSLSKLLGMTNEDAMILLLQLSNATKADLAETTKLKGDALKLMSEMSKKLQIAEVTKFQEQMDKAIEDQQKAKKAGIFSVVFDFIISAVEVVSGALKLAAGNPAGAIDIAAGLAGFVKVGAEIALLVDPDNQTAKDVAEWAGKIQFGFEIVGMAVDIFNIARAFRAVAPIAKATETAAKQALTTAGKNVGEGVAKEVATKVAQQIGESVATQVGEGVGKVLSKEMAKVVTQQAIEKMVEEGVKKALEQATKKGLEVGSEAFIKTVAKNAAHETAALAKSALKKAANVVLLNVTRAAMKGSAQVTGGVIETLRADNQKDIQKAQALINWLSQVSDMLDKSSEELRKAIEGLLSQQADITSGVSEALKKRNDVMTQLIGGMH